MFKNKYGEIRSGWSVALSVALLFVFSMLVGSILPGVNENLQSIITNLLITGAVLVLFRLLYRRPYKQMGIYSEGRVKHTLLGALCGILMVSLMVVILLLFGAVELQNFNPGNLVNILILLVLLDYIVVGFFEEIVFRGHIMTALKTTRSLWVIILVSSVLFSLVHGTNDNITPLALINLTLAGVILGYLFIKTGRLWAPIGFHITWNFTQGTIYGSAVSGGVRDMTLVSSYMTGPDWLTGGTFGFEGGLACTAAIVISLIVLHFCVKQNDSFWTINSNMPLTKEK